MANARVVLQQMYDHFPNGSRVKTYLQRSCTHLLEAPTGDTQIPQSIFDAEHLTQYAQLPSKYSSSVMKDLNSTTGVYSIYSPDSHKHCVGSAIDFDSRFDNHYDDRLKPRLSQRPLYAEVHRVLLFLP